MELKDYQVHTLNAFTRWRDELAVARVQSEMAVAALEEKGLEVLPEQRNYPRAAWRNMASRGEVPFATRPYVDRTTPSGLPIPHICFKVPTGGGKTLLAAAALERLNQGSGLVLWMVPSNAIYQQTKEKLWDKQHPYRQMLEWGSGGRVKVLEKNDPFTAADVEYYLCVMLISLQSANQQHNQEYYKIFQDSGRYTSFFPDVDNPLGDASLRKRFPDLDPPTHGRPVAHSLSNVFKMVRPVVVLDEAHKAYGKQGGDSEEFVQSINRLNPSLVIELSATPSIGKSNLLVDVAGKDLKVEDMIKLPVQVTSYANADWHHTLSQAHAKLEELDKEAVSLNHSEGRYIRPIAVVRVERTGHDQHTPNLVHAEDVRKYLTQNLGVPAQAVAVQSSVTRELAGVDLLSQFSPVRWIITKAALMEGWDCPFAYLLVMLDNTSARRAITQLVGRVMRQPDTKLTGRESLDQCYVYCQSTDVNQAVQFVKDGLEQEGMGDLDDDVSASQSTTFRTIPIQRREKFRDLDIFLPKVLHRSADGALEELDYQRHILPSINLSAIGPPALQGAQARRPQVETAAVDVEEDGFSAIYRPPQTIQVDQSVRIEWYARRISHVMPNPFQAARIVQELVQRMRDEGVDDASIYGQRSPMASQLCEHVVSAMEQQAEQIFRDKLRNGEIRFDLTASDPNHRIRQRHAILVAENDSRLERFGQPVQLSLFEPVYEKEFNDLERRFAFYLDEHRALRWWHRIAVRQHGEYYLQGWRRERIWPDFVAMAGATEGKPSLVVFETKGDLLTGHEDTEYKNRVFAALESSLNAGKMTIRDGPARGVFRLVFDREGFPDAEKALAELPSAYVA